MTRSSRVAAAVVAAAALAAPLLVAAPATAQDALRDTIIALQATMVGRWEGTSEALDFNTGEFVTDENYGFTFGLISEDGADRAFWGGEFNVLGVYQGDGKMFESVWVGGALFQERDIWFQNIEGPDAAGNWSFNVGYETPDPDGALWEGHDELAMNDGVFTIRQQIRPAGTDGEYFQTGYFVLERAE